MSNVTARYVDTCLPGYLTDSYCRPGQTLCMSLLGFDLATTVEELFESIDFDAGIPDSVSDEDICRALRKALDGVDLRYIDEHGNRQSGRNDGLIFDEPYLYVVLEWEV